MLEGTRDASIYGFICFALQGGSHQRGSKFRLVNGLAFGLMGRGGRQIQSLLAIQPIERDVSIVHINVGWIEEGFFRSQYILGTIGVLDRDCSGSASLECKTLT